MDMDDALPAALAANLDAAFERLVLDQQDRLYSIALRVLGNRSDAEEVAQDALVRAYRALGSWDEHRIRAVELRPWLAAITVNLCRNRLRRRRPPQIPIQSGSGTAPEAVLPDPREGPDAGSLRRESVERWAALLAELPPRHRVPVVLRHVDGLSYEEMAAALGRPTGTLKAQVHRGLAQLRAAAERAADLEREEMTA